MFSITNILIRLSFQAPLRIFRWESKLNLAILVRSFDLLTLLIDRTMISTHHRDILHPHIRVEDFINTLHAVLIPFLHYLLTGSIAHVLLQIHYIFLWVKNAYNFISFNRIWVLCEGLSNFLRGLSLSEVGVNLFKVYDFFHFGHPL